MSGPSALIFAKFPEVGAVKTRMVPPLTLAQAAELHRASLLAVCEIVNQVGFAAVNVVVTPDERVDDMREIIGDAAAECRPQGEGDLGRRLVRAVDWAFSEGAGRVLVFGADSPTLPLSYIRRAVSMLDHHDAVLGPCGDGGYYLLGMNRPLAKLFDGIDWGGPQVTAQTRRRAADAGLDLALLPQWYDLDRFEDLQRAGANPAGENECAGPNAVRLHRLIQSYVECYRHGRSH